MTLATEIGLVKTEIASSLSASLYTAKDLVYVAKAIEALANAEGSTGIFTEATISTILYVSFVPLSPFTSNISTSIIVYPLLLL